MIYSSSQRAKFQLIMRGLMMLSPRSLVMRGYSTYKLQNCKCIGCRNVKI